jgi:hypothetical protein
MSGIRAVYHVNGVDAALHLLSDALKHPFRSGAFDAHADPGVSGLERLPELLRHRQIHGGIEGKLSFLPSSLDQRRRDRRWLDRHSLSVRMLREAARPRQNAAGEDGAGCSQHIAPGSSISAVMRGLDARIHVF